MCSESSGFQDLLAENRAPVHVARYFNFLSAQPKFASVTETWSMEKAALDNRSSSIQVWNYFDLRYAWWNNKCEFAGHVVRLI